MNGLWNRCAAAAVLIGIALAVVVLPIVLVTVLLAMGFALTAGVLFAERTATEPEQSWEARTTADVVRFSLLVSACGVGFIGLIMVLHWVAVVATAALALTSPPVTNRLVARHRTAPDPAAPPIRNRTGPDAHHVLLTDDVPLADLTDDWLCLRWRASYNALADAGAGAELLSACTYRAALLDELERRDPEGFRHWIDSGARAAGDPRPFLTRQRP